MSVSVAPRNPWRPSQPSEHVMDLLLKNLSRRPEDRRGAAATRCTEAGQVAVYRRVWCSGRLRVIVRRSFSS